ncbi:MAG: HEAT repeat domain-containing protein [Methanolinea sp.]|nr:MAG: HEAT repeat domain-containing protein [Methanolinea sp.]
MRMTGRKRPGHLELRDPEAVEPLTAALGDQSRYVRREAAKALGAIGENGVFPL